MEQSVGTISQWYVDDKLYDLKDANLEKTVNNKYTIVTSKNMDYMGGEKELSIIYEEEEEDKYDYGFVDGKYNYIVPSYPYGTAYGNAKNDPIGYCKDGYNQTDNDIIYIFAVDSAGEMPEFQFGAKFLNGMDYEYNLTVFDGSWEKIL